jgi:DNA-binding NarL/FixJ family response regulator
VSARLVLADDHPIVLDGLRRLFEAEPGWRVVASCTDGEATLQAVREHRPDLLILDLRMPRVGGLSVLRRMAEEGAAAVPVIVLTAGLDNDDLVEVVRLGARGVVLKDQAPGLLVEGARAVLAGGRYLQKEVAGPLLDRLFAREHARERLTRILTARELEIARLAARGLRSKEVAAELGIAEGTIKIHLHNVYQKLGVASRVELVNDLREAGVT